MANENQRLIPSHATFACEEFEKYAEMVFVDRKSAKATADVYIGAVCRKTPYCDNIGQRFLRKVLSPS